MKQGLLLINLGTPKASDRRSVRRYLKAFLSDPFVLDLPFFVRYALLYGVILPFRVKKTTQAYQQIWTKDGSPLRTFSALLEKKLQETCGTNYQVALGMRYGEPSIASAIDKLSHCQSITLLPLYPQFAQSTTQSSIEHVLALLKKKSILPSLNIIRDFYQHPGFINPLAALIKPHVATHEHFLFSYHGLPKRHIVKTGCHDVCEHACPEPASFNPGCYRAQCFSTSRALAKELGLKQTQYTTAFQSRLGKTPWIGPDTTQVLQELRQQGIQNLAVSTPSFVTDCLETLEEIGMRAAEQWLAMGGKRFTLIPCLNDSSLWVEGIMTMCHDNTCRLES